jgi:hypothetical protein
LTLQRPVMTAAGPGLEAGLLFHGVPAAHSVGPTPHHPISLADCSFATALAARDERSMREPEDAGITSRD